MENSNNGTAMNNTSINKICSLCKIEKTLNDFYVRKESNDGYRHDCKDCVKNRSKQYALNNVETIKQNKKEYREKHKESAAEYHKEYYANHKEYFYNQAKKRVEENREQVRLKQREWYDNNKEHKRLYDIEYKKNNPRDKNIKADYQRQRRKTEIGRAMMINYLHNRRLKIKDGDVTPKQLIELKGASKKCYWCGILIKNTIAHFDHYMPIAKGGKHTISNLVVSCAKCNQTKNATDPFLFAQSIGKLL